MEAKEGGMIDLAATFLCIASQGFLAWKFPKTGFILSMFGSSLWFIFAIGVHSPALAMQSVAFLSFSAIGLAKQHDSTAG